jgi:hypothetical protein
MRLHGEKQLAWIWVVFPKRFGLVSLSAPFLVAGKHKLMILKKFY